MSAGIDFLSGVWDILRKKLMDRGQNVSPTVRTLIEKNYELKLSELEGFSHENDPDVALYLSSLIVLRLREEAPCGDSKINFIDYINYILTQDPPFKQSMTSTATSWLITELTDCKSPNTLFIWAKKIKELEFSAASEPLNNALLIAFNKLMWEKIDLCMNPTNPDQTCEYLGWIITAQTLGIEVKDFVSIVLMSICKYIEKKHDLDDIQKALGQEIDRNCSGSATIIKVAAKIKIDQQELTKRIETIVEKIGHFAIESEEPVEVAPQPSQNPHLLKNFSEIEFLELIYGNSSDQYGVSVWKARHPKLQLIAVKEYTAKRSIADLDKVKEEINVLNKLSSLASPENCFLKYYGDWINQNKIYLVMEFQPNTLMSIMTYYRDNRISMPESYLLNIIKKLLESFAIMESLGIFHKDIKPHNLLVSDQFDIKIIDFSISAVKSAMDTTLVTGMNSIQGTKGYVAPEIEDALVKGVKSQVFSLGKADVFSLGLCFLQILIMEDLNGLNTFENSNKLFDKLKRVEVEWAKNLIYHMIQKDYQKRLSFRRLIKELPGVITTGN